jgi:hypothetical protein
VNASTEAIDGVVLHHRWIVLWIAVMLVLWDSNNSMQQDACLRHNNQKEAIVGSGFSDQFTAITYSYM